MNRHRPTLLFVLAVLSIFAPGCQILGVIAAKAPRPDTPPSYRGMEGQTVGVMVWADPGLRVDWPTIQLDLANAVQNGLAAKAKTAKKDGALAGATFPVAPVKILRYQEDHPEIEYESIANTAPQFGVTRLLYIELEDFTTRSAVTNELFRGSATANLRLVEVSNGKGTVVLEESGIATVFPRKVPEEGMPQGNDYSFYIGTLTSLSEQLVNRFVPHQEED